MTLREKVENAFANYLKKAVGGDVRYLTGLGDFEVLYPAVICSFMGSTEMHPQASHFNVEVMVTTVSSANTKTIPDAAQIHSKLVGGVVRALEIEGLEDQLTSEEPDLIINGITETREEQPDIDERNDEPVFASSFTLTFPAGHK